jgi:hypothetical protein
MHKNLAVTHALHNYTKLLITIIFYRITPPLESNLEYPKCSNVDANATALEMVNAQGKLQLKE